MAVALTDFSGFCGFRPPTQIAAFLDTVPEFSAVVGESVAESFKTKFSSSSSASEDDKKAGLKDLFSALMRAEDELVKAQVEKLVARVAQDGANLDKEERELVQTLDGDFPGDVGVFCTFVLNIVRLKPGEAVFLKANEPHAYLDGGASSSLSPLSPAHSPAPGLTLSPSSRVRRHHGVHGYVGCALAAVVDAPRTTCR